MSKIEAIVWDFDGVLNKNARNRHFFWTDRFEEDFGHCPMEFEAHVFHNGGDALARGDIDIPEKLQAWADHVDFAHSVDDLIEYWYARDLFPDQTLLDMITELDKHGLHQVIGTNSAPHRARWVEHDIGFGNHVSKVYASGHLGVCKPYPDFFAHIEDDLRLPGANILLIDDFAENVEGARAHGWQAHHYEWEGYEAVRQAVGIG